MAEASPKVKTNENENDERNETVAQQQGGQSETPKDKMPVGSYFCLCQIVCYSFGLLGTRAVMPLYLRNKLGYTNNEATAIIHGMDLMKFFTPIGAVIADSFWNRYWIVIICLIVSTVARMFLFVGSMTVVVVYVKSARLFTYGYYFLLGMSLVGLDSAIMSFRGDQFKLPAQQPAFQKYVHVQYYLHNISVTFSYLLTPLLKSEIHCLGEQDCYCAAFGMSTIFIVFSVTVFAAGYKYYTIKRPAGNMMVLVSKCIGDALRQRHIERSTNPRPHWLDYAEPMYGAQLVDDVKRMFSLIKVFATIPIFFSLYTQYMTKWLFQASRMDGRIGSYTIVPDHYQLFNPLVILIAMPLTIKVIDPHLKRWHMDRSLRRMIFGGFVAALSFVIAGVLEIALKKTNPILPGKGVAQLRIFNGLACDCVIFSDDFVDFPVTEVNKLGAYTNKHFPVTGNMSFTISSIGPCGKFEKLPTFLMERKATSIFITPGKNGTHIRTYEETVKKAESGIPYLTIHGVYPLERIVLQDSKGTNVTISHASQTFAPESYNIYVDRRKIYNFKMFLGGGYVLVIYDGRKVIEHVVTEPNSIHMFWIFPQTFILCIAEIYFLLTLTEFTYSQAPESMKAIVSSMRIISLGMGHTLVIFFTLVSHLEEDVKYFLFAGLMFVDIIVLIFVGAKFKPISPDVKLI